MLCAIFCGAIYIRKAEWECSVQPYPMLCAIIGGYIFSCLSGNPLYLMLCATLTYALCYFCGAVYILKAEWECSVQPYLMLCAIICGYIFSCLSGNAHYLRLCATVTYALCYLWGYKNYVY